MSSVVSLRTHGSEETSDALQALLWSGYFGDSQSKITVDQHHFTAGDDLVTNDQVDRIRHVAVQFNHVAGAQLQNLAQRHLAAAETKRGLKFYVEQQLDAGT